MAELKRTGRSRKTPAAKAAVTGQADKQKSKKGSGGVHKDLKPVGKPFDTMSTEEQDAWALFVSELPWLTSADRPVLQAACQLRAQMDGGIPLAIGQMSSYITLLSKLGATPVDRERLSFSDDETEDPLDHFFATNSPKKAN